MKIAVLNYSFLSWVIKVIKTIMHMCDTNTYIRQHIHMTYLYTKIILRIVRRRYVSIFSSFNDCKIRSVIIYIYTTFNFYIYVSCFYFWLTMSGRTRPNRPIFWKLLEPALVRSQWSIRLPAESIAPKLLGEKKSSPILFPFFLLI